MELGSSHHVGFIDELFSGFEDISRLEPQAFLAVQEGTAQRSFPGVP